MLKALNHLCFVGDTHSVILNKAEHSHTWGASPGPLHRNRCWGKGINTWTYPDNNILCPAVLRAAPCCLFNSETMWGESIATTTPDGKERGREGSAQQHQHSWGETGVQLELGTGPSDTEMIDGNEQHRWEIQGWVRIAEAPITSPHCSQIQEKIAQSHPACLVCVCREARWGSYSKHCYHQPQQWHLSWGLFACCVGVSACFVAVVNF